MIAKSKGGAQVPLIGAAVLDELAVGNLSIGESRALIGAAAECGKVYVCKACVLALFGQKHLHLKHQQYSEVIKGSHLFVRGTLAKHPFKCARCGAYGDYCFVPSHVALSYVKNLK
jgi:hypothetical protein